MEIQAQSKVVSENVRKQEFQRLSSSGRDASPCVWTPKGTTLMEIKLTCNWGKSQIVITPQSGNLWLVLCICVIPALKLKVILEGI